MKYCSNCGTKLFLKANFCSKCGEKLNFETSKEETSDDFFVMPIQKKGEDRLYGVMNAKGNWIIKPEYENIRYLNRLKDNFNTPLLLCQKAGKFGIIDTNSQIVIPFNYDWLNATVAGENIYIVAQLGTLYGVIDSSANWVIPPKYQLLRHCCATENNVVILEVETEGDTGFITLKDEWFIKPGIYEEFSWIEDQEGNDSEIGIIGLNYDDDTSITLKLCDSNLEDIHLKNTLDVHPVYDTINKRLVHLTEDNGFFGFKEIYPNNTWIVKPEFHLNENDIGIKNHILYKDNSSYVYNTIGELIETFDFLIENRCEYLGNKKIQVFEKEDNTVFSIIDTSKKSITSTALEANSIYKDLKGHFIYSSKNLKGLMNSNLNKITTAKYDFLNTITNDYLEGSFNEWEDTEILDNKGNIVFSTENTNQKYEFDCDNYFTNVKTHLIFVSQNHNIGIYDLESKTWLIQPIYPFYETELELDENDEVVEVLETNLIEEDEYLTTGWDDEEENDEDEENNEEEIMFSELPDFQLFLSQYVDNKHTFIGHSDVKKCIMNKFKSVKNFFEFSFTDYESDDIEELSATAQFYFIYEFKTSGIHSTILVFGFEGRTDLFFTVIGIENDQVMIARGINLKLEVLKEKRYSAIISIHEPDENPVGNFELLKSDGGILTLPFSKWKFTLEDIVNAINDMMYSA